VAAVLNGDSDAFAILVRRYQNGYARFAVRMLGNRADADDVLQSAFIRAFRKLNECRNGASFGAWLYQIVVNECRTFATRRQKREQRLVQDDELLERTGVLPETADSGLHEEIQHALDQLDPLHREVFILKHVEELSYEEISRLTGVGISALKMRVKRAGDRLRKLLEGVPHVR
jgi:RNA polymerase sigma-70 factor (ECF subfamily)